MINVIEQGGKYYVGDTNPTCECENEEEAVKLAAMAAGLARGKIAQLEFNIKNIELVYSGANEWQQRHIETHKAMLDFIKEMKELAL